MRVFVEFSSQDELLREVHESFLHGRALLTRPCDAEPSARSPCELVLIHPSSGREFPLAAEIVFIDDNTDTMGLEFCDWAAERREALLRFVVGGESSSSRLLAPSNSQNLPDLPEVDSEGLELEPVGPSSVGGEQSGPDSEWDTTAEVGLLNDALDDQTSVDDGVQESEDDDPVAPSSGGLVPPLFERLRHLNAAQREKFARSPSLQERKALERIYGASVWEALLNNSYITGPEVARIARNGMAPIPVIQSIAANGAFLAKPEVRRALLSNPRLGGVAIERVLRALPLTELKLVPRQTAYPAKVRAAADRLLGRK